MDIAELKEAREVAVKAMQEALDNVEPIGAPVALVTLMITPFYIWKVLRIAVLFMIAMFRNMGRMVWGMVTLPFYVAYFYVDTILLLTWFFKRTIKRMSE